MNETAACASAGGHRLEYRLLPGDGTPGRPVLVFLHEGLGSVSKWRDAPGQLAARTGCPALVYSRYGHGGSDVLAEPRQPAFMLAEGATVLPELLRSLGIGNLVLIGHSDGATIALAYLAAGHPARAAIVVAPHVCDEEITWRSIARVREDWDRGELRDRLARHHADAERTFLGWADVWLSAGMRGWTMVPSLAAIRCPVLAIQGVDDPYGTMAQVEHIAAASGGPVEIVKLERCGHDPFREQPEATLAVAAAFIRAHALAGAARIASHGSAAPGP